MVVNESRIVRLISGAYCNASKYDIWKCTTLTMIILLIYSFRNFLRAFLLGLKLRGPPVRSITGHASLMASDKALPAMIPGINYAYGPIPRCWLFFVPYFVVMEPDHLQLVLSSKENNNKLLFYRFLQNYLGNGLITSSGEKWSSHRRLLQPAFHLSILDRFIGSFADASQLLLEKFSPLVGQDINICSHINTCVVDILNEIVLGVPIKKNITNINMEESPFRKGRQTATERLTKPWLIFDGIFRLTSLASDEINQKKHLNDFTLKMVNIRRDLRKNGNEKLTNCLLDFMIDVSKKNPEFTDEDIVNEACTFMLAGQDSVSGAVAITLFFLAQNPDCQAKCYEELESIFEDDNRPPTLADLREMTYLEMCIKESLRLQPTVPLIARTLGEDIHTKDFTIPVGAGVMICPYMTHRLEKYYPDAETFDPDRFLPQEVKKRHPYAYIPFSAGPRNCLGSRFAIWEMKTLISRLLRSYKIQPVAGKTTINPIHRIALRISGGVWVHFTPRNAKTSKAMQ